MAGELDGIEESEVWAADQAALEQKRETRHELIDLHHYMTRIKGMRDFRMDSTNPLGLAKRCLLGDGLIVPVEDVDDAEDADDESSSRIDSGKGFT